jgi:ABC-type Mn2+/Zn2+ transport system permease subunit
MALAIGGGLVSVLVGLTVSYYGNLPPGGTIVLTAAGLFLLAALTDAARARL